MFNFKNKRILIVNSKISKYPSNKGVLPLEDNIAYKIMYRDILKNRYIVIDVTLPFIDGITVKTNGGIILPEEKTQFFKKLYHDWKLSRGKYDGEYKIIYHPMNERQKRKCGYEHHFCIWFLDIRSPVHLFFQPFEEKARFLKFEFSLWKIGNLGWRKLEHWFDENMPHWTFEQFISEADSIGSFELTVDIIGLHLNDIYYHGGFTGKEIYWKSKGNIETLYLKNRPRKSSVVKVYDKVKQCKDTGEKLPYGGGLPVTRIEQTIVTTYSLKDLVRLKAGYLKDMPFSSFLCSNDNLPCDRAHAINCKDAMIARGTRRVMKRFYQHERKKYREYFLKQQIKFLFKFDDISFWRATWERSLLYSGVLVEVPSKKS